MPKTFDEPAGLFEQEEQGRRALLLLEEAAAHVRAGTTAENYAQWSKRWHSAATLAVTGVLEMVRTGAWFACAAAQKDGEDDG
jgi:hypothetical protein